MAIKITACCIVLLRWLDHNLNVAFDRLLDFLFNPLERMAASSHRFFQEANHLAKRGEQAATAKELERLTHPPEHN